MKVQKTIDIQLIKKRLPRPIDAVQYDTGIQLVFNMLDFGTPNGTTATLYVQKPSGRFVYQETGITVAGSTITVDLHNQALTEHGDNIPYQVQLKNGADVITTFSGIMRVEKSLADSGAVESKTVLAAFAEVTAEQIAEIKAACQQESTRQQDLIAAKGAAVLETIPEDYTALSTGLKTKAPAIVCDASGSMVTVTDGYSEPVVAGVSHIEPVQEGSGDPSPDNVRHISGWDAAELNLYGKNLLAEVVVLSGVFLKALVRLKAGVTYTLSVQQMPDALYFSDESGSVDYVANTRSMSLTFTVGTTGRYSVLARYGGGANVAYNMMLEVGTTATAYEPYKQAQTLSASLPETVYGGKLDWTTGVLTVTHKQMMLNGTEANWTDYQGISGCTLPIGMRISDAAQDFYCAAFPVAKNTAFVTPGIVAGLNSAYLYFVKVYEVFGVSDLAGFKAYLAEHPLQIVYPVATPYTIQLTPQQLSTLKGTNNVWSDCGSTELTYIADTKIYIDNKFAELAKAVLNNV